MKVDLLVGFEVRKRDRMIIKVVLLLQCTYSKYTSKEELPDVEEEMQELIHKNKAIERVT